MTRSSTPKYPSPLQLLEAELEALEHIRDYLIGQLNVSRHDSGHPYVDGLTPLRLARFKQKITTYDRMLAVVDNMAEAKRVRIAKKQPKENPVT